MKPRIDIISGFLGAGKTTLILEMLKSLPAGERIAVCENEFGEVGIDGGVLKAQNLEVVEINAGCVCCTLSLNLIMGIKMLAAQYQPTRILLEPTGLASLSDILNILRREDMGSVADVGTTAAVLDGGAVFHYHDRFQEYFETQIAAASVLFINRMDQMNDEDKLKLADLIEGINPNARIVAEPFDSAGIWEALDAPASPNSAIASLPKAWLKSFKQVSVQTGWPGSKERLDEFIGGQRSAGEIIRAKGYVADSQGARLRVDFSDGEWMFQPAGEDGPDSLQFIGRNISIQTIREFFQAI